MTATADDLARRLVESPHWRWLPRMRAVTEDHQAATVLHVDDDGHCLMVWGDDEGYAQQEWDAEPGAPAWLPDLSDPATEGCLLALAREAWDSSVDVEDYGTGSVRVVVGYDTESRGFTGATLGEALAHAILAAGEVGDVG